LSECQENFIIEKSVLSRVVDEISLSQIFAKYLFRISRNNFFYFAKFCIAKYYKILQNFAKYRKIFVKKLKFVD
jgi:hypothetical protein